MKHRAELLILLIIILTSFMIWAANNARDELLLVARVLMVAIAIGAVILVILLFGWVIMRLRVYNHQVAASLADSQVTTVVVGETENLFIRDSNDDATWHNTGLDPRAEIGRNLPVAVEEENQRWHYFTQFKFLSRMKGGRGQNEQLLLEGDQNMMSFLEDDQTALPPPNILDILGQAQRALIVGPSNAGKTTLLNHYIRQCQAAGPGEILVIDPHAEPSHWRGCKVVGISSNHPEISETLEKLIRIMEKRYEEIGKGLVKTGQHPPISVIIDEWMSIANMCPNASHVMVRLLTESRKAAFSVIICSHSQRIKSLGLTGQGDLKEGFTVVKLMLTPDERRKALIDMGDGVDTEAELPGPFVDYGGDVPVLEPSQTEVWDTLLNDDNLMNPSDLEQQAFERYEAGQSLRKITPDLFGGDKKYGKHYNVKFFNLCTRFDIPIHPEHDWRFVQMKKTPYQPEATPEKPEFDPAPLPVV